MKVEGIDKMRMRNDEHFQFHTEIIRTISSLNQEKLKVDVFLTQYKADFDVLDEGLKKIVKSEYTQSIHEADKSRDEVFHALVAICKGYVDHPLDAKRDAARRLKIVFDTYGNIAKKPLNEQTAALHNILQDLEGQYSADITKLGVADLKNELKSRNDALSVLVAKRYDEATSRTDVVVKEARIKTDASYDEICDEIYALWRVEGRGEGVHKIAISSINTIISKYRAIMHARSGKKSHHKEVEEEK